MNIFESANIGNTTRVPLAERMKPKDLDDVVGQDSLLKDGGILRKLISSDSIRSIIFYGPPGTGKTSIAKVISNTTNSEFIIINAVNGGIKDIRDAVDTAKEKRMYSIKTIVFIDEIHRFNKLQQDALLPYVEEGLISLIGATTENPYFEVNSALVSRSILFELKELDRDSLEKIVKRAIERDRIFSGVDVTFKEDALEALITASNNDARRILNILEMLYIVNEEDNSLLITKERVADIVQVSPMLYSEDVHYDIISAFIKSVRGSDVDAALYYLAKMLLSGEDPKFIARRLIILASEDIGLADINALTVANNAFIAVDKIGMPEARIVLSNATIYLALTDKSNSSYMAINNAYSYVQNNNTNTMPQYLRDSTKLKMKDYKNTYKYPHNYKNSYVEQRYLPLEVDEKFYSKSDNKKENELFEKYLKRKKNE